MKRKLLVIMLMLSMAAVGCGTTTEGNDGVGPVISDSSVISIGEYKGIEYTPMDTTVSDEDLEESMSYLETYIQGMTNLEEIDKESLEAEDWVNITCSVTINGETADDLSLEDYDMQIGSGTFPEDVENSLIGHKKGDNYNFETEITEEYNENFAGEIANYNITINSIKESVPVELNDETAIEMGYENLEALRESYREELEAENEYYAEIQKENDVIATFLETCEFEIGEQDKEMYKAYLTSLYQSYADGYGVTYDEFIENYMGMDAETFDEQLDVMAEDQIKYELAMEEVFKQEGLNVDDYYDEYAESYLTSLDYETVDEMEEALGREEIEKQVRCDVAFDVIADNAVAATSSIE